MNVLEKFGGILFKPRETFSKLRKEKSPANAEVFFALAIILDLLLMLPAKVAVIGASIVISVLLLAVRATTAHVLGRLFFRIKAGCGSTVRIFLYWGAVVKIKGILESLLWAYMLVLSPDQLRIFGYPPLFVISVLVDIYLLYVLAVGLGVTYDIPVLYAFIIAFGSSVGALYFLAWILPIIQGLVYP